MSPVTASSVTAFLAAVAMMLASQGASAQSPGSVEARLLRAMSNSPTRVDRLEEIGSAIRAYISAGLVDRKPTRRIVYTDYRVLKAPATLLGQKLLVIEEEYLIQFIGCCVNEGVGAIVELAGDETPLREFARRNGCLIDQESVRERLRDLGLRKVGKAAAISCRVRDAL